MTPLRRRARARTSRHRRARSRRSGMTLLEILVSLGILAMIALLIFGAFDSMSRGKRGESIRADRARQGRDAVARIAREISGAFLSLHNPANLALATRETAFIATSSSDFDRLDFASFSHRRIVKDSHESDQCEISYFVAKDPDIDGKMDLVRREQTPIDLVPNHGGVVNVLAENVEKFELLYFDPLSGQWVERWDTRQATGQLNRLPLEVKVTLVLKEVAHTPPFRFTTKVMVPMQQPLSFGIPR